MSSINLFCYGLSVGLMRSRDKNTFKLVVILGTQYIKGGIFCPLPQDRNATLKFEMLCSHNGHYVDFVGVNLVFHLVSLFVHISVEHLRFSDQLYRCTLESRLLVHPKHDVSPDTVGALYHPLVFIFTIPFFLYEY